ncbi:MAG: RraA family protein [Lachnospiraceae bacterium]|nr:RraA family protein [Lachnospiraceae bacterium]MBQ9562230.1 RraA family protein [Lachnospiraceae bacterium]MBQ9592827.1 RraA family protein [Lachnospiraceae bacterium]MBR0152771.1 RraA family protein [Lachnospiraceae bacterium]
MGKLTLEEEIAIMKELEQFDTPSITNVVATYPGQSTCLSLYHPWDTNWYTDDSLRAMYPELGPRCGFAVTCTYGIPDPNFKGGPGIGDVLRAIGNSPKPVVLLIKQDYPEKYKRKNGLCGGNMATAFKSAGCVAIISDGPSRDVDEVRPMGIQYMLTGVSPGHGPMGVKAVNTPVEICGMDVAPGEIVHLDENGAVKFPREYLAEVLENCRKLREKEEKKQAMLRSTDDVELLAKYMKGIYD